MFKRFIIKENMIKIGGKEIHNIDVDVSKAEDGSGTMVYSMMDEAEVIPRPELILYVGQQYKLNINAKGYPFYITTNPIGGCKEINYEGSIEIRPENSSSLGNVGIEIGSLIWTPKGSHSQMELYYQCNYYPNMGNKIIVKYPEY